MIKLKSIINELKLINISKSLDDEVYFVLYKDKLFLLDDESNPKDLIDHMWSHPLFSRTKDNKYNILNNYDSINGLIQELPTHAADIVAGTYDKTNGNIYVYSSGEVTPVTSLNVKKIANFLKVNNIYYDIQKDPWSYDPDQKKVSRKNLIGNIPEKLYHGTTAIYLKDILTNGLFPSHERSNFSDREVFNPEHIFFAGDFNTSIYYAKNATDKIKSSDTFPVILELTVPDKSLVVPDYDADNSISSPLYYNKKFKPEAATSMSSMGISRETGKWGYKGRIPSKFIRWVYYYNNYDKKWHKSNPSVWKKLMDKYDLDIISYKLGQEKYD